MRMASGVHSFVASTGDPNEIAGLGGHGGTLTASDGYRCSFADPDDPNSFVYEDPDCYLGMVAGQANDVWWRITTDRGDSARASTGSSACCGGSSI